MKVAGVCGVHINVNDSAKKKKKFECLLSMYQEDFGIIAMNGSRFSFCSKRECNLMNVNF